MQELLKLIGSFTVAALFSYGLALLIIRFLGRKKRNFTPEVNSGMRFKTSGTLYRCRFISTEGRQWVFSAPLQRDSYVPLAVGEKTVCELTCKNGLLRFCSEISGRDSMTGTIRMLIPESSELVDRRSEERIELFNDTRASLNGHSCCLLDRSDHGAKISIESEVKLNEVVSLTYPNGSTKVGTIVHTDRLGGLNLARVALQRTF